MMEYSTWTEQVPVGSEFRLTGNAGSIYKVVGVVDTVYLRGVFFVEKFLCCESHEWLSTVHFYDRERFLRWVAGPLEEENTDD